METNAVRIKPLCLSVAAILLLETAAYFLATCDMLNLLITLIIRIAEIAAFLIIFSQSYQKRAAIGLAETGLAAIGLARRQLLPGFIRGLIWSAGFGIIAGVLFLALYLWGINPFKLFHTRLPATSSRLLLFFLVGGIIGPLAEEIFFRGILYGYLRRWGVIAAITLSTLVFVAAHPGASYIQATGGILFAVSYEIEGKLMAPITIHCLGNMILFSLSFLV
jgi:CAAX protease family protein